MDGEDTSEPVVTEEDEDGEWVVADTDDDDKLTDQLISELPE